MQHESATAAPNTLPGRTDLLLLAGVLAGVQVTVVSALLAAIEPGFDIRRHPNSLLVLGDWGWVQTVDIVLYGLLLTAFAVGAWRVTRPHRSGAVAAAGIGIYGLLGGVVVGLNPAPPMFGFPPGARPDSAPFEELGLSAKVHGVAGMIGFLAMTVACFALARYFAAVRSRGWAVASACIGVAVVAVCCYLGMNAGTQVESFNYIPTWVVGAALWLFVAAVAAKLYVQWRNASQSATSSKSP